MAWNLRDLHDALANAGEKIQQMCMAAVEGLPKRGRKIHGLYTCEEQEGMVPAFAREREMYIMQRTVASRTSVGMNHKGIQKGARVDNVMYELAGSPAEIKARLAGVPVYTVVNSKKEFILVSGDDDTERQLSLLFLNREDAEGFQKTIKKENPKLGRSSQVLSTSLEAVYEFTMSPSSVHGTEGVCFRFMPDSRQVEKALEVRPSRYMMPTGMIARLYNNAGITRDGFVGVPLFQAEGLTVKGDSGRYTPLFFSKDDLDIALRDTFVNQNESEKKDLEAKIQRARQELTDLETSIKGEAHGKSRRKMEKSISETRKRLEDYKKRQKEENRNKTYPRVDVGSFEEVLLKMEADAKGEWNDVIFVPGGSLSESQPSADK